MFKQLDINRLQGKRVMLAPANALSASLFSSLQKADVNFVGFIDGNKEGDGIYNFQNYHCQKPDLVLIISPNYWLEINRLITKAPTLIIEILWRRKFVFNDDFKGRLAARFYSFIQSIKRYKRNVKVKLQKYQSVLGIPLSINSYRLLSLKNKYKGQRAFIIGTGPSLKNSDLNRLSEEITFACNKIFLAFENTSWRPTLYTIEDPLDIAEYIDDVSEFLDSSQMIFPEAYLDSHKRIAKAIHYEALSSKIGFEREFSSDMLTGIFGGESVVYGMLQMLCYMGVEEIYLLGVDFTYFFNQQKSSPYLIGQGEVNHFHQDYRQVGDLWVEPRLENSIGEYTKAREQAESLGIRIVNATRGGALEVFTRADFDSLVK